VSASQALRRAILTGAARRRPKWSVGAVLVVLMLPAAGASAGGTSSSHFARERFALAPQQSDWERAAELESSDPVAAAIAFLEALRASAGDVSGPHQALGFRLGAALAESGDLADAAALQLALHARVGADWSAINATITLMRLGRLDDAAALLAEHESRAAAAADVANYRGLVALACADVTLARRHFSRALVLGSRDAGLSLARMDLLGGHPSAARAGFRPSVDDAAPHAWALRGWALTLLP
jgi:hypothetical protein